jgi:threonine aldolase
MQRTHDAAWRGFASDNYAGVHPEVMQALTAANGGHQISYGEDVYTEHLMRVMETHFGKGIEVFPVFNGTGANVTSLQAMLPRWGAVICSSTAHLGTDESVAPQSVGHFALLPVTSVHGKITPELIDEQAYGFGDEHHPQPAVVSIAQSTELGTVYTVDEVRAIADHVHKLGMYLHMDGARISNAAASLGVSLRAITRDAGVDVLSFGGTKNGLMGAEAIVVFTPDAAPGLIYLRKMNMQLASKMRFISAQLCALLEGDLWHRNAHHANKMASLLRSSLDGLPKLTFTNPTEANGVFVILPPGVADELRKEFRFYDWNPNTGEVRWMCAWDTTADDVEAFAAAVRALVK